VILTAGNAQGYLLPEYFQRVVDSKGNKLDLTNDPTESSSSTSTASTATSSSSAPLQDSNNPAHKKVHRAKKKPKSQRNQSHNVENTSTDYVS
jgi:hypothetical protein